MLLLNVLKKLEVYIDKNTKENKDIDFYLNGNYKIHPYFESIRISIIYGIVGALWIALSDKLLGKFITDIDAYTKLATYKGWAYVIITMMLIYSLVLKRLILFKKSLKKIADNFEELNANNEELVALEEEIRQQFEELEKNRNALIISEQRYELAVEGSDSGIWDWDIENNICYFSLKWKSYLGFEDDEVENNFESWVNLLHPEEKNQVVSTINTYILSKSGAYENVYRMRCRNGEYRWILSKAKAIRNSECKVIRIAGSHTDVTEERLVENKLNSLAYYDKLTELPNRFLFEEKVNDLIVEQNKQNKQFALIYMDIDNFKHINDTLGHSSGDLLLKYISNILKYQVKAPNLVARLGGDEFAIVFEDIKDRQDVINKIQNLLKYLRRPWIINKQEFFISYSIGITIYPEHGDTLSLLLKNSDIAMYFVKKDVKDNYCFYSLEMQEKNLDKINMINDLRHAIDNNEFTLFYQPIIDLNSGKLSGAEALIRWFHPRKGMISPMEFIPLAEKVGLIYDIDNFVLKEALMQKQQWEELGYA